MNKNTAIDECLKVIPQRYELVILAAQRARLLYLGANSALPTKEKNESKVEVALHEIAQGYCTKQSILESFNNSIDVHQYEEDEETTNFYVKEIKEGISYDDFDIDEE